MGLDSVEIVIGWERALGITISDAEANSIRTPRAAIDLLAAKLHAVNNHQGACLTFRAFTRIRRGLIAGASVRRSDVRPDTRIRDLLPGLRIQHRWQAAQAASGLPALPSLGWGVGLLSPPTTIADAAHWVVCNSPKSLKATSEPWTRHEIRTVVRMVVTEVCGATGYSDHDDFVSQIGID